jgi:CHAT domain-containing protein
LVVASQWKVDSEGDQRIDDCFSPEPRRESMSTVDSLRQAQLEMIKTVKDERAFYWVPFRLFGGYATY